MKIRTIILCITVGLLVNHDALARQKRSSAAKTAFKHQQPCPSTGRSTGKCPGYIIDHIKPLDCGGADAPNNMQWQTTRAAKAKDAWERDDCSLNHSYSRQSIDTTSIRMPDFAAGSPKKSASTGFNSDNDRLARERIYGRSSSGGASSSGSYYRGPRGGCYTMTPSGNKHYVDRSLCN